MGIIIVFYTLHGDGDIYILRRCFYTFLKTSQLTLHGVPKIVPFVMFRVVISLTSRKGILWLKLVRLV